MTILFESYHEQNASMRFHRAPRVRLIDRAGGVFLLHCAPEAHAETQLNVSAAMVLRHAAPRVRLADRTGGVFLLHRAPEATLSGGVPIPTATVFALNGRGPRARMTATIGYTASMHFHRQPSVLLAGAGARFSLHRQHGMFLYDGAVRMERMAVLLQQPVLMSSVVQGLQMQLADQFTANSKPDADWIHALLDLFTVSSRYSQAAMVLQALADGMSLADVARAIIQSDLLDSFIATGVLVNTAQVTVLLADGFELDENASSLAEILAALRDGFYATITVNTGDDIYTAWVMTTQTKAMRSYSNFPFNSYATLGGQFMGAATAGIYRMGGNKDAGEAIRWAIRTGKLDFGTLSMKGAPLVYIGATTSGDLLMKVQATTIRGDMAEQTYRMTPAVTGEPREHRQQVGRGFRSVYWTFELCNDTDGATAEVHEWHAVPVKHTGKLI